MLVSWFQRRVIPSPFEVLQEYFRQLELLDGRMPTTLLAAKSRRPFDPFVFLPHGL